MRLLNIVLALTSLWTLSDAFGSTRSSDKNKVQLSNVKTLTLRNNALTSARRVSAIPQVKCIGGNAKSLYDVDVIRCKNSGSDYSSEDIQWTCQASLPPEFKLGSTDVICEGYDSPDDPYILKGSCGVEYRLVLTPMGEEKYGQRSEGFFGGESRKTSIADMINWFFTLFIVGVIIYGAYQAFTGGNRRRPRSWDDWGGRGGGDDDGNDPPPPYTPRAPGKSTQSSTGQRPGQEGWRPGFWTGTAAGAAAGYMAGNRGNRTETRREPWANDTVGPSRSSGRGSSSSSASPSSSRYESTGFGGTSRR